MTVMQQISELNFALYEAQLNDNRAEAARILGEMRYLATLL